MSTTHIPQVEFAPTREHSTKHFAQFTYNLPNGYSVHVISSHRPDDSWRIQSYCNDEFITAIVEGTDEDIASCLLDLSRRTAVDTN